MMLAHGTKCFEIFSFLLIKTHFIILIFLVGSIIQKYKYYPFCKTKDITIGKLYTLFIIIHLIMIYGQNICIETIYRKTIIIIINTTYTIQCTVHIINIMS